MYVPGFHVNFTVATLCRLFSKNNPSEKACSLNIMNTIKTQLLFVPNIIALTIWRWGGRQTVLDSVSTYHFVQYLFTKFVSPGKVNISVFLGTGLEPTVHQL